MDLVPNGGSTIRPRREIEFQIIVPIQRTPSIQHRVAPDLPEPADSAMEILEVLTVGVQKIKICLGRIDRRLGSGIIGWPNVRIGRPSGLRQDDFLIPGRFVTEPVDRTGN